MRELFSSCSVTPAIWTGAGSRNSGPSKWQTRRSLRLVTVSLLGAWLILPGRSAPPEVVDTSEALAIGSFAVTAYRVDKNYRRFADSASQPDQGPNSPEKIQKWFAYFLSQQVIIAEARREGYGERAEVCAEVDRMERHMLSQPNGPFYESLAAGSATPAPDWVFLYEKQKQAYDVAILRVPTGSPAAATLSRSLAANPPSEWEPLLTATKESGQADYFEGSLMWPFEPFEEIAPLLESASPGLWQHATANTTLFLYQMRGVRDVPSPPFETIKPALHHFSRQTAERQRQRERRSLILPALQFSLDWMIAGQVVERLKAIKPDPLRPLDLGMFTDLPAMPLGRFNDHGTDQIITVADYINYFNGLFFRRLPGKPWDIYSQVQDLAVARRDFDEARSLGIDQQPKFSEDRENYRNYLALDLYEKERIRPKLNITDDQIVRYYQEHGDEFVHPSRIAGALVIFYRMEAAHAFAQDPTAFEMSGQASQALATESMVLTPETQVAGIPFLPKLVFSQMKTPVLGPFPKNNSFAVWISRQTLESTTTPFAQAVPSIRAQLEKSLLEPYETELARTLSRGLKIADRIDYQRYGVTETVAKPWSQ